jgi:hypothetical protein
MVSTKLQILTDVMLEGLLFIAGVLETQKA